MGTQDQRHEMLWRSRYGSNSATYLSRSMLLPSEPRPPVVSPTGWTASAGRAWRRMPTKAQWVAAIAVFIGMQSAAPPSGVVFVVLLVVLLAVTGDSEPPSATVERAPRPSRKTAELASATSIEAQVAGAASRAWDETRVEPSWSSPLLAGTRAAFDGRREVDAIVDLALRILHARVALGESPAGPARAIWQG
ncbi:MAG TPA: hypothetical protein VN520_15265, partial [Streptomyces sp.]|uniref:hypothetical protein n=1 Tax=Streptomyces sp. TaxID=1931 RepID=UPI002BB23563